MSYPRLWQWPNHQDDHEMEDADSVSYNTEAITPSPLQRPSAQLRLPTAQALRHPPGQIGEHSSDNNPSRGGTSVDTSHLAFSGNPMNIRHVLHTGDVTHRGLGLDTAGPSSNRNAQPHTLPHRELLVFSGEEIANTPLQIPGDFQIISHSQESVQTVSGVSVDDSNSAAISHESLGSTGTLQEPTNATIDGLPTQTLQDASTNIVLPPPELFQRPRRRMTRQTPVRHSCTACMEDFIADKLVDVACGCRYCKQCLNSAFRAGCSSVLTFPPRCCGTPLRISVWGPLLDNEVLVQYKKIEAEVGSANCFYCAIPTCSALIPHKEDLGQSDAAICPECFSVTCRRCRKSKDDHPSWQLASRTCPSEDPATLALLDLSSQQKWKQCPKCLNMVERIDGCPHMGCVCGIEFCYHCGSLYDEDDRCRCEDNLPDEENADRESEEDEWPDFRAAVDAFGMPTCGHSRTQPVEHDEELFCHGCLQSQDELRRCEVCNVELCEACLNDIRVRVEFQQDVV